MPLVTMWENVIYITYSGACDPLICGEPVFASIYLIPIWLLYKVHQVMLHLHLSDQQFNSLGCESYYSFDSSL